MIMIIIINDGCQLCYAMMCIYYLTGHMLEHSEIKQDILKNYPLWQDVSQQNIKITKMAGITNLTYKVEVEGASLRPIIYRRFGESNQNIFLSRDEEAHIYKALSDSGDGPKIFYHDNNIRLEEFLDSSVLQTKDMLAPGTLEDLAYTLANFHNIKLESPLISRVNLIQKTFVNNQKQMLEVCQAKLNKKIYSTEEQELVSALKEWVTEQEIAFVAGVLKKFQDEPLVFSHNDLLAGNVLVRKDNNKSVFIDYEYSSFNFPFYDIANYFDEALIDYEVDQPPFFAMMPQRPDVEDMKVRFIDAYNIGRDYGYEEFRIKFDQLRKERKYLKQREEMQSRMVVGRLLCSFMWGWWAIIVSKNPHINFDYIKFAKWRQQNYNICKASFTK